jgi:hypothetical protein
MNRFHVFPRHLHAKGHVNFENNIRNGRHENLAAFHTYGDLILDTLVFCRFKYTSLYEEIRNPSNTRAETESKGRYR